MNRINPEKLRDELAAAIAIIDLDMSKDGTISNIVDRSARSTLSLLMSVMEGATDHTIMDEDIRELKEQMLRLQVENGKLKRRLKPE